jgi:hypothetical protein
LKYQNTFKLDNKIHVAASSNSRRALKMDMSDRRWLIPGVTETLKDHGYWKAFRNWLNDDGLAIIANWAKEYVAIAENLVEAGEHSPITKAKERTIFDTMSEGEQLISDFADTLIEMKELKIAAVVRLDYLRAWLSTAKLADGANYLEKPETIIYILKSKGLIVSSHERRFRDDKGKRFQAVANFKLDEYAGGKLAWKELEERTQLVEGFELRFDQTSPLKATFLYPCESAQAEAQVVWEPKQIAKWEPPI